MSEILQQPPCGKRNVEWKIHTAYIVYLTDNSILLTDAYVVRKKCLGMLISLGAVF